MKKEERKKKKIEKAKQLSERWALQRWITEYINKNTEKWDAEKKEKENMINKELEDCKRLRF